jgi:hypothetical protein
MFGGKVSFEEREKEREKTYKHKNGGFSIKCACESYVRLMMSTEDEKIKSSAHQSHSLFSHGPSFSAHPSRGHGLHSRTSHPETQVLFFDEHGQ